MNLAGSSLIDLKAEAKLSSNESQTMTQSNEHLGEPVTQPDSAVLSDGGVLATGRLERELSALDAVGFKTQAWKSDLDSVSSIVTAGIDIDWLIAQPQLPYLVQVLPTHLLYRSIMNHGVEDSLEVLEWVRGSALVKLMDYDLWTTAQGRQELMTAEEAPSGERFLQWIRWWNEINPEFAAQRVMELDEGLIIGCMTAASEIIPVGLNRNQEELSDEYWITPDQRFGIKMKTSEESDFEVYHQFIHALYKQDIRLAQAVLAHSAMLIREESIEEARRWRNGRLEDQGFLSPDEARHLLNPKSNKQLAEILRIAAQTEPKRYSTVDTSRASEDENNIAGLASSDLHESLYEYVQTRDKEELAQEIEQTLGTSEIVRLVGTSAPQSDILLQDDDVLDAFVEKIAGQTQRLLLNLEAQKARALKSRLQTSDSKLIFEEALAWISEDSLSRVMDYKTRIARTANAVAASLGVANESNELARVLAAVRGCLNIGLERLLKDSGALLPVNLVGTDSAEKTNLPVAQAAALLTQVGPEAVFQVGWQTLQELSSDALQQLVYIVDNNEQLRVKVGSDYMVQLSDGEAVNLSVLQLQARGRYVEVRKWLRRVESIFEPAVQLILDSTLNRLPVFPIVLLEENVVSRASTAVKPYEELKEVEITRVFLSRLTHLLSVKNRGNEC